MVTVMLDYSVKRHIIVRRISALPQNRFFFFGNVNGYFHFLVLLKSCYILTTTLERFTTEDIAS